MSFTIYRSKGGKATNFNEVDIITTEPNIPEPPGTIIQYNGAKWNYVQHPIEAIQINQNQIKEMKVKLSSLENMILHVAKVQNTAFPRNMAVFTQKQEDYRLNLSADRMTMAVESINTTEVDIVSNINIVQFSDGNVYILQAGTQTINGSTGNDRVIFAGTQQDYTFASSTDGMTIIITKRSTGDVCTITNVETLSFDDGNISVSRDDMVLVLTVQMVEKIEVVGTTIVRVVGISPPESAAALPASVSTPTTAISSFVSTHLIDTKIDSLVDSAPSMLNTLNELATALGDDPNFARNITGRVTNVERTFTQLTDSLRGANQAIMTESMRAMSKELDIESEIQMILAMLN